MRLIDRIKAAGIRYKCSSYTDEINTSRELLQYCILTALSQSGFFEHAAFLGGTSLRLFRGLDRFSEDLDFSLIKANKEFSFKQFIEKSNKYLNELGLDVEITDKSKIESNVRKVFAKDNSIAQLLEFSWALRKTDTPKKINVKIEVDVNPPEGAVFEKKYTNFPETASINLYDMPSSFAGKCHALLTRKYIKGRDWYDFLFYVSQKIEPNYILLTNALKQTGNYNLKEQPINKESLNILLKEKIKTLDFEMIRKDLVGFIPIDRKGFIDSFDRKLFESATDKLYSYSINQNIISDKTKGSRSDDDGGFSGY